MNKKLKTFYSRKPNRSPFHNYTANGYYYVTACTYNRAELLGTIENDQMILNTFGEIVKNIWLEIPEHFAGVELDEHIIMPNHIHGIIIINNPVRTGHALSSNKKNNLSTIIGSFKSAAAKRINQLNNHPFKWQRSFYDHRIRTEKSLKNIRRYIINNPATWADDENNPVRTGYTLSSDKVEGKACLAPTGQF